MINARQKKKITSLLGKHYSVEIQNYLSDKGITNTNGEPYSSLSIRQVVNGLRGNLVIETEIYNLLQYRKETQAELKDKFKSL